MSNRDQYLVIHDVAIFGVALVVALITMAATGEGIFALLAFLAVGGVCVAVARGTLSRKAEGA